MKTAKEVLDIEMMLNDAAAPTVREYLKALLRRLVFEGEGFDSKRPFGNSGWEADLEAALVKAGAVRGTIDEDGCAEDVDRDAVARLLDNAIKALQ